MKPPMSWLQKVKPERPNESPPRSVEAIPMSEVIESPPQWSG